MRLKVLFVLLAGLSFVFAGCDVNVNKSVRVENGKEMRHDLNSVNGSIAIGSDCEIHGHARTVNGSVRVGDGSKVKDLDTVNGRVEIGEKVSVDGSLNTVNGRVQTGKGSEIREHVGTVNGSIVLNGTNVGRDVFTHNGDITLLGGSTVSGDIVIKKSNSFSLRKRRMVIRLSDHSIVEGDVDVRDKNVDATVILENGSEVRGQIRGAATERR